MAATTKIITVDIKAIEPIYPDAENSKPTIEAIKETIRTQYESQRKAYNAQIANDELERNLRGFPLRDSAAGYVAPFEYPEYDSAITFAAVFGQGTTVNGVVTVELTITLTIADGFAFAVNLLDKITIEGTFAINPTNRVTGY